MKKFIDNIMSWLFVTSWIWIPLLILAVSLGLVYLIATSSLPDWVKWFLLR